LAFRWFSGNVAALVVPIVLHQPKPWSDAKIEEKCGFITDDGLQKTCRDYYAQINHNIRKKTDKEYRQSEERRIDCFMRQAVLEHTGRDIYQRSCK
jgi:hypothetical protein